MTRLTLNLAAPFLMGRQAAERMKKGGLIVNISDAGLGKTWSGYPAYLSAIRAGTLTRLQAKTYGAEYTVNASQPGLRIPPRNNTEEWDNWLVAALKPLFLWMNSPMLCFSY